jgi:Tol biopolymer transport system component
MTSPQRFEQDLPALLADTYLAGIPDYRDDLVRQVAAVRQRPAWTFPGRWLPMDLVTERVRTPGVPWRAVGVLALIALLIASLVAAFVGSQPRRPPPFGLAANGLIAYGTSGDILVRDSPTGEARVLVGGDTDDHDPWFTPDGSRLTFMRTVSGADLLMVATADGRDIRQLIADPIRNPWAAYSPDSRSIAFVNDVKGIPRLAIIPLDGSPPLEVDLGGIVPTDLAWRPPDGRQLLVRGRKADMTIDFFLLNADGTGLTPIGVPSHKNFGIDWDNSGPAWSSDGSRIVYNVVEKADVERGGYFRVHIIGVDGNGDRALPGPTDKGIQENWPAVSPDGKSILVHRWMWDEADDGWLAIMPADGSGVARDVGPRVKGGVDTGLLKAWSPDASHVLLRASNTGQSWSIDAVTGQYVELPWDTSALPDWQRKAMP